MLRCNFRYWLADYKINSIQKAVSFTGLSRNTIVKLWSEEKLETVELSTLIKICDVFRRPLSELVEYVPENTY